MKFAKITDIVTTVFFGLITILLFIAALSMLGLFSQPLEMAGEAVDSVSGLNGSGPGDGYILIGGLFSAGFLGLAGAIMWVFGALALIFGAIFLILTVTCIVRYSKFNNLGDAKLLRKNITTKITLNTVLLVLMLINVFTDFEVASLIWSLVFAALEVLYVMARRKVDDEITKQEVLSGTLYAGNAGMQNGMNGGYNNYPRY